MGLFHNSKQESEEIRGVSDDALPKLTNEGLIMLALARLYEGQGIDDEAIIAELYLRGRSQRMF